MAKAKSRSSSSRSRGAGGSRKGSRGVGSRSSSRGSSRASSGGGASSKVTTNPDEIRQWAEERGGRPACVRGTGSGESCLLRIDFPGGAEESLEEIGWDEFFDIFRENKLAFLYQDAKKGGEQSYFNKLIDRNQAKGQGGRGGRSGSRSSNRGGSRSSGRKAARHGRGSR